MINPQPSDMISGPACGAAGFLARVMEYLNRTHSSEAGIFEDEEGNKHYRQLVEANASAEQIKNNAQYAAWLKEIKQSFLQTQLKAAICVNRKLVHGVHPTRNVTLRSNRMNTCDV